VNERLTVVGCEPAQEAMCNGWNPVIVDNTNTQAWQMLPYVKLVCRLSVDHSVMIVTIITRRSWTSDSAPVLQRR